MCSAYSLAHLIAKWRMQCVKNSQIRLDLNTSPLTRGDLDLTMMEEETGSRNRNIGRTRLLISNKDLPTLFFSQPFPCFLIWVFSQNPPQNRHFLDALASLGLMIETDSLES